MLLPAALLLSCAPKQAPQSTVPSGQASGTAAVHAAIERPPVTEPAPPPWPPVERPLPVPLDSLDRDQKRVAVLDYLVRAITWDLTQNYRIDPEQYGPRDELLYIPIAVYSVQLNTQGDDWELGTGCVAGLAEQLSDSLADMPPFAYAADDLHPELRTRLQPAEVGDWEIGKYKQLVEDRVVAVQPGVMLQSPPMVLLVLEEGRFGQLRAVARIIPLEAVEVVTARNGYTRVRWGNPDKVPTYRATYSGGVHFAPELADLCPGEEPTFERVDTVSTPTRQDQPWLDVRYLLANAGSVRSVEPPAVTCIGDRILPTVTAPRDGYVYIVQHTSGGECRTVFPAPGQDHRVRAGVPLQLTLPDGRPFDVLGPAGLDRTWIHWSPDGELDTRALLSDLGGDHCSLDQARRYFADRSTRYRSWGDAGKPGPVEDTWLAGEGETVEAIFPVAHCE